MGSSTVFRGLVVLVFGLLFLLAARHWSRRVVPLNRRLFGSPRSESGRTMEELNRVSGAVFIGGIGALMVVVGMVWVVLGVIDS